MTTPRPFALRLFVPSGLPEGMRIVEKTNWSGIGYVNPSLPAQGVHPAPGGRSTWRVHAHGSQP